MRPEPNELEFAGRIREALDRATAGLGEHTTRRLFESRQRALYHHSETVAILSFAGIGQVAGDVVRGHLRAILAFLALAVGAMGAQYWHTLKQASELAEIDIAVLSDEVSPSAYTDQGFMEWLRNISEQENESLPE